MAVVLHCAYCGREIGEIMQIPGENHVGCPYCQGVTNAIITRDGSARMAPYTPPPQQARPKSSPSHPAQQAKYDWVYRYMHAEGGIPSLPEYDIFSKSWRIRYPTH